MRRTWEINPILDEDGREFLPDDLVDQELVTMRGALKRFGGFLVLAPKRVRYDDGSYDTVGWVLKYDSGMPAVPARPEPVIEPAEPDEPELPIEVEPEPAVAR